MYPTNRTILMIGPVGIAGVAWLLIFAGLVKAEEQSTAIAPTTYLWTTGTIRVPAPMATINANGTVKINWEAVERAAADQASDSTYNRSMARLMLAIRDGTWKAP